MQLHPIVGSDRTQPQWTAVYDLPCKDLYSVDGSL